MHWMYHPHVTVSFTTAAALSISRNNISHIAQSYFYSLLWMRMVRNIFPGKPPQEISMENITFAWKMQDREESTELYVQIETCSCHKRWGCYGTLGVGWSRKCGSDALESRASLHTLQSPALFSHKAERKVNTNSNSRHLLRLSTRHSKCFKYINPSNPHKQPVYRWSNYGIEKCIDTCPRLQSWQQPNGNLSLSSVSHTLGSSNLIETALNVIVNVEHRSTKKEELVFWKHTPSTRCTVINGSA